MYTRVEFDETEVSAILSEIIEHKNKKEFIKLLTPMICEQSRGVSHLFKCFLNQKLPERIPNGTLCKIPVANLGYGANTKKIGESSLVDNDGNVVVRVTDFKGYHNYSNYMISYTDIDDNGTEHPNSTTHVDIGALTPMEEF
jgi:hypothetical protein